jgi:hypothetical protein
MTWGDVAGLVSGYILGFDLCFWRLNLGLFWSLKMANSFIFNKSFSLFRINSIFSHFEASSGNRLAAAEPCPVRCRASDASTKIAYQEARILSSAG